MASEIEQLSGPATDEDEASAMSPSAIAQELSPKAEDLSPKPLHRTIIRPASGWRLVNVRELWQYRELLYFLTWRDVKVRYKQTVLGAAWAILQPAMMMVVFSIFFGRMAHVNTGGLPYPLFVFCGLLPWTFFATSIANAGNSVVGSERLITKIYFPRLAIPFASVGAALVDFAVAFSMLLVLMLWYRVTPTWNLLFVPPLIALFTLAALGVGTMLAALNVAYRDFRYVIPFLVQLWMFATPTVYMQPVDDDSPKSKVQSPKSLENTANTESAIFDSPGRSPREESAIFDSPGRNPVEGTGNREQGTGDKAEGRRQKTEANPKSKIQNPKSDEGAVPDHVQHLLNLNPLTGLVAAFRAAVVGGPIPWSMLRWSTAGVVLSFLLGCLYFRRVEDSFADII